MAKIIRATFAESAFSDLDDIKAFYKSEGLPETGNRLISELLSEVERLRVYPKSGRIVPEFNVEYLREIIHPPFRIVYRYDKNRVRVVRIWRSERLLKMP
ncbi:MAG: type II toxin-antitoxin system RelE/ParE family toxin [Nitrospirae bacterium]|nr:type II toxin-antitoxin system RelE/ParE family toxin [Nitrospirota bacterium]